jgi:hypothetical protein
LVCQRADPIFAGTTAKNIARAAGAGAGVMNDTGYRIVAIGMVMNFHMTFPSTPTMLMIEFPRTMVLRGLVIIPIVSCKYWWTLHDAGLPPRAYRCLGSPRQL